MSHKRTGSAAGNTAELPEAKRRPEDHNSPVEGEDDGPTRSQQPAVGGYGFDDDYPAEETSTTVYAVMSRQGTSSSESITIAIYSTLGDANNRVCRLRNNFWTKERMAEARIAKPLCSGGVDSRGYAYWSIDSNDDWKEGVLVDIRDLVVRGPSDESALGWYKLSENTPWDELPIENDEDEEEEYSEGENDRPWH